MTQLHSEFPTPPATAGLIPPGHPWRMGQVISWTNDRDGYERRERVAGIADCPKCGRSVELIDETDKWRWSDRSRRWFHAGYGPAQGVCCGMLIVDSFEGCHARRISLGVYDLRGAKKKGAAVQ